MSVTRTLNGEPSVSLYDGRQLLGIIIDRPDGCEAADGHRRYIGKFRNWRDASTAIHEAKAAASDALRDAHATRSTRRAERTSRKALSEADVHADAEATL